MITLLSPAKSLDYERAVPAVDLTRPVFEDDAERLATAAAKLTAPRLRALMGISPALAKLNVGRFRGWSEAPERAAAFAFAGDVYRGFRAWAMTPDELLFAQAHVRLLSGLYGVLRPFDTIRPYRLEMGTGWAPGRARDLYAWWGDRVSGRIAAELADAGDATILNLASQEYAHVVLQAPPAGVRIVAVDFRERKAGELRFNSFAAKRARGTLARWLCEQRVDRIDGVSGFDLDGYRFDADASGADSLHFVRAA